MVALVDIRHDAQKLDAQMLDFLEDAELPFVVALTKADKLSRSKQDQQAARLSKQLAIQRANMIITSAQKGTGIDELRRRVQQACE